MNFVNEEGEILHEPMELEDTKGKVSTLQYDMYTPELTETVAACSGSPHIQSRWGLSTEMVRGH